MTELAVDRVAYDSYGDEFKVGVGIRIFNAPLKNAIRAKGWTLPYTANKLGIAVGTLNTYLSFRSYPDEERRLEIAILLGVPDDVLFPESIAGLRLKKQPEPLEIGQADAEAMGLLSSSGSQDGDPERIAEASDLRRQLMTALSTLRPNERAVITARFGLGGEEPKTFREVAAQPIGANGQFVSPARVAGIEQTALKKLRARHNRDLLRAYA